MHIVDDKPSFEIQGSDGQSLQLVTARGAPPLSYKYELADSDLFHLWSPAPPKSF